MGRIRVMDEILANKIAAGEVVERCSSVVKELVENAIDADSTEILVDLIESGTKEIKVIDNGNGMDENDIQLAFLRHATSKIVEEDDLYSITTLGFRGEALPSISSVSEMDVRSSQGTIGTEITLRGGKMESYGKCDARKGTTIVVKNLFYNTPARLKYLKSLYAELASTTDYMNKIALSYPHIRFRLTNNGRVLLNTDGSGNLLKVVKEIYGIEVTKKMLEIDGENDDYHVHGFISYPEASKSNRNHMITMVDGRVVRNQELNRVINDAYHTYKPESRYPITILDITVDPSLIDVNIHPTKMDIKFSKMESLKELIDRLIQKKLKEYLFIPKVRKNEGVKVPTQEKEQQTFDFVEPNREIETFAEIHEAEMEYSKDLVEEIQKDDSKEEVGDQLPELYPIGAVGGTYIVCHNHLGMYLIDQHAAKERCNYEKYLYKLSHPKEEKTQMLFPITIELSSQDFLIIEQNMDLLRDMNFDIEEFGINTLSITAHPTWLPEGYEKDAIQKILELVCEREKNFDLARFRDHVAATISCKLAIKANDRISLEEMEHLIADLRRCKNPYTCPHGRPTIIHYPYYELEKLFKRVM